MVQAKKLVESGIRSFAHLQIGHAWAREFSVRQLVSLLRKAFCCGKSLDWSRGNLTIALSTCKSITRATAHQFGPRMKNRADISHKDKQSQKLNLRKFFTNRCKVAGRQFSRRHLEKHGFHEHKPCHFTHFSGFNGFCALSKTTEAVRTPPSHFYTPLKRGVNEKNQLRMTMLVKYSG